MFFETDFKRSFINLNKLKKLNYFNSRDKINLVNRSGYE